MEYMSLKEILLDTLNLLCLIKRIELIFRMQQILLREEIETLRSEIDHQERTMTSEQVLLNTVAVIFLPEIRGYTENREK